MKARDIVTQVLTQLGVQMDLEKPAQVGSSLRVLFNTAQKTYGIDNQFQVLKDYISQEKAKFFAPDWKESFKSGRWKELIRGAGGTDTKDIAYIEHIGLYFARMLKGEGGDSGIGAYMVYTAYLVEFSLTSEQREELLHELLKEYFEIDRAKLREVLARPEHIFAFITVYALMRVGHSTKDQNEQLDYYRCWAADYTGLPALRTRLEINKSRQKELGIYYNALWKKYHQLKRRDREDTDPVSLSRRFVLQKFQSCDERDKGLVYPTQSRENGNRFQRVIFGPSGTGKTSFLHSVILTMIYADCNNVPELDRTVFRDYSGKLFRRHEAGMIPLFVRGLIFGRIISEYTEESASDTLFRCAWMLSKVDDECIRDDMEATTKLEGDIPADLLELFREEAGEGRLMLILDAYDEAADRSLLFKYLHQFASDYPQVNMLITSRPLGPKNNLKQSRWNIQFGDEQKRELICRWCSNDAAEPHVCKDELTEDERIRYEEKCSYLEGNHLKKDFAYNPYLLTTFLYSVEGSCSMPVLLQDMELSILQKMLADDSRFGGSIMQRLDKEGTNDYTMLREFQDLAYDSLFVRKYGNRVTEEQIGSMVAKALKRVPMSVLLQPNLTQQEKTMLLLQESKINRTSYMLNHMFSTQPGLLVAGEDQDFMFLSDLFLCHMAVERMMEEIHNRTSSDEESVRLVIEKLEGVKDHAMYANVCTILLFALGSKAVDEEKAKLMFEAVTRSMVCRLACTLDREGTDQLLTGICDILLGRYAASDMSAGKVGESMVGTIKWCREVLLLNVLPRVQGRTDLKPGYVASYEEILSSAAALQIENRLAQFGYFVVKD